jgi:hypothetical protein
MAAALDKLAHLRLIDPMRAAAGFQFWTCQAALAQAIHSK